MQGSIPGESHAQNPQILGVQAGSSRSWELWGPLWEKLALETRPRS